MVVVILDKQYKWTMHVYFSFYSIKKFKRNYKNYKNITIIKLWVIFYEKVYSIKRLRIDAKYNITVA